MRINPDATTGDEPYAIPPSNPFADGSGGAPEVWLYRVRNPWRFWFDTLTNDLWVADVGQNEVEELDLLVAGSDDRGRGANLGWNLAEGTPAVRGRDGPSGATGPRSSSTTTSMPR